MNELATPSLLTTQDFLAMPEEDQVEYELIRGELRQHPTTRRNFSHSRTTTNIAASSIGTRKSPANPTCPA